MPERFQGDQLLTYGYDSLRSSIQNWLPALMLKYLGVPPEIPAWFFLYLQHVLMGMGIYYLTLLATNRVILAATASLFVFLAAPLGWNLATYGVAGFRFPYSAEHASAVLVIAVVALLRNRLTLFGVLAGLAALLHPSLTLMSCVSFSLYILFEFKESGFSRLIKRFALVAIVAALCLLPVILLQTQGAEKLTAVEWMDTAAYHNQHAVPWNYATEGPWYKSNGGGWRMYLWTVFGVSWLAFLSLSIRREVDAKYYKYFLCAAATALLICPIQPIGVLLQQPEMILFMSLRWPAIVAVISIPLLMVYLAGRWSKPNFPAIWASSLLLMCLSLFSYGLFWGPLLALTLVDASEGRLGPFSFHNGKRFAQIAGCSAWLILIAWVSLWLVGIPNVRGPHLHGHTRFYYRSQFSFRTILAGTFLFALFLVLLSNSYLSGKLSDWSTRVWPDISAFFKDSPGNR